jgi:dTDP-4-amino-4,6-dideoxygalactose transaminase
MNKIYITKPILPDLELVQAKLHEIWSSGWLTNNGEQHRLLELKLKNFLDARNISLFNNGTIALLVALKALDIEPGAEIITTPFTFPATPHSIFWNNFTPVFVDISEENYNISPKAIEAAITHKTKAILAVHVYGTPCNVEAISQIAKKHNLKVIYDAAHAFDTRIDGKPIFEWGDISMLSFHATKLFHSIEGGALVFNDPKLKNKIELLKNFGIKDEETVLSEGINGKMNEVQAAVGQIVLDLVKSEQDKRRHILTRYLTNLKNIPGIIPQNFEQNIQSSLQYFTIRVKPELFGSSRDDIYLKMKDHDIYVRKYFYPLCSNYDCYKNLPSSRQTNLPIANTIANQMLSLPFYGELDLDIVDRICNIIKGMKQ